MFVFFTFLQIMEKFVYSIDPFKNHVAMLMNPVLSNLSGLKTNLKLCQNFTIGDSDHSGLWI